MAEKKVANLVIVVEYDELPDMEDLARIVDDLNGAGAVKKADLSIVKDTLINLCRC